MNQSDLLVVEKRKCARDKIRVRNKVRVQHGYEVWRLIVLRKNAQGMIDVAGFRALVIWPAKVSNVVLLAEITQPVTAPVIQHKNLNVRMIAGLGSDDRPFQNGLLLVVRGDQNRDFWRRIRFPPGFVLLDFRRPISGSGQDCERAQRREQIMLPMQRMTN